MAVQNSDRNDRFYCTCISHPILQNRPLAEAIEREVFHQHKRILSSGYKRTMRNLVFTLRHQTDIREKVLNKQIEITDFVKDYRKEGNITDFVKNNKKDTKI